MLHSRMLGYLDEVAKAGSIRQAAERLGIAASSINRQIIALEEEYGVTLFERLPRRLRLTVAGELLIAHVRQTLRDQEALRSRFADLQGQRRGLVRIAAVSGIVPAVMPELLAWLRTDLPFVKLFVRTMPADRIIGALLAGDAEFGLGYELAPDPRMGVVARARSRIGAVMAPHHPLAGNADVSLAECIGYPMVVPDPSIAIGALLHEELERAAIGAETVASTNSVELLRRAPLSGDTISFLSEIEARADRGVRAIAFVPIRDAEATTQEFSLLVRRSFRLDAAQSRVADKLRAILARVAGPERAGA